MAMIRRTVNGAGRRYFATSTLSSFDWNHRGMSWEYSYTVVSPDQIGSSKGTIVFFPSATLLSSREEWRSCAELMADAGYTSLLMDWPGWHHRNSPMNWSIEDDADQNTLVSTWTDLAYSSLKHATAVHFAAQSPLHVVSATGSSGVHVTRALRELCLEDNRSATFTCFSPTWRYYLARSTDEGYPRRFARRRAVLESFLSSVFVRSKMMFRLYKSKWGLSKLTKRLYEEKIQHSPDLLEAKREILMRDRPLTLDAAMLAGRFDPVSSTPDFLRELMVSDPTATENDHRDDSDDDDSLLNVKLPNWRKVDATSSTTTADPAAPDNSVPTQIRVHLVIPEDVSGQDKKDLETIVKWAEHANIPISRVQGKLFCHEEYPAQSATVLQLFLDNSLV